MSARPLYKIIFHNQGKVYEIYARGVHQGSMLGFVEVEKIVFGKRSSVVVDPSEEGLKSEFANVARTYIPLHAIVRIDEVSRQGTAKITELPVGSANVMPFPLYSRGGEDSKP
jgi:hypothetical protein